MSSGRPHHVHIVAGSWRQHLRSSVSIASWTGMIRIDPTTSGQNKPNKAVVDNRLLASSRNDPLDYNP
jgi:hypothetical protein